MALTDVEICNLALSRLGIRAITTLSDGTPEADACSLNYDYLRQALLVDFQWTFATSYFTLTENAESVTCPGWTYVYSWPAGCLAARRIYNASERTTDYDSVKFHVFWSGSQSKRYIATDQEDAVLIGTYNMTTVTEFSRWFIQALVLILAARLCQALKGDPQLTQQVHQEYQIVMDRAISANAMEQTTEPSSDCSLLSARGYGG